MHNDIRMTLLDYRNKERLAAYKARRAEFIEKYCKTPDKDLEAFYGVEMAQYIDARQWWEYLDADQEAIDDYQSKPPF